ncbi:FmdB family zinc ribbon protein [Pusillimonas minor]|uniref:Zinc ribbon domain-containing protein n=1 Tax=Pusillimonas minor TaxID=2697024 RepID=A0A842HJX9_9BURK|nr:zinc ribbon domain-containing protein [Pusillimonas minor]
MPIYAYKCSACGHAEDVLQKISDPLLTQCPQCGQSTYAKQVTAAGFQLKGSGWYVTDFRGGASASGASGATASGSADTGSSTTAASAPAATPAAAPAPSAT